MVPCLARFFAASAAALLLACAAGCSSRASVAPAAPSTSPSAAARPAPETPTDLVGPSEAIVALHKSKCGSCHTRVEPGSLARATAESAMQRHRRRAKLSEREWEGMVDYLSADHPNHRPTARIP
jgi:hypothetical protein